MKCQDLGKEMFTEKRPKKNDEKSKKKG